MSLGDYDILNQCNTAEIPDLLTTLENAAIKHFVVMASGNDGGDVMNSIPGCINGRPGTKLVTVAAVTCGKQCALFSNYGEPVDWVAVGTDVFTTYLKDQATGNWTFMVASGTSISAGVISGVIHARGGPPIAGGRVIECRTLPTGPTLKYRFGRWRDDWFN